MTQPANPSRRTLLRKFALGLSVAPLVAAPAAHGADAPLLSESDPAAKAVRYVEDAGRAKEATPGTNCSNCSLYGDAGGAPQSSCTLFPGKLVKAAGWCNAWSGL